MEIWGHFQIFSISKSLPLHGYDNLSWLLSTSKHVSQVKEHSISFEINIMTGLDMRIGLEFLGRNPPKIPPQILLKI